MFVGPGVEVKTVKGDSLLTNADGGDVRADLAIEAVFVYAEVAGRLTEPDESGRDRRCGFSHAWSPSCRRAVKLTWSPYVQFLRAEGGWADASRRESRHNSNRRSAKSERLRSIGRCFGVGNAAGRAHHEEERSTFLAIYTYRPR
jgi:hypothetical protein